MGLLDGKVVVVTGAGGGLGRCHALACAAEGADLVINDVAPAHDDELRPAEQVCEEVVAMGRKAAPHFEDISSWEGAESLIRTAREELGRIDVLINNAGILRDKTLKKMTEEQWDLVLKVHAKGTFACTHFAALAFAEQGEGGRVVNTTSIAGLMGNFGQSNYSAAKAAIYGLTRTHSMELAKDGVMVNAIAPVAKTAMTEDLDAIPEDLKPEMVSPLVVYLASPLCEGVTGRVFGCHGNHYFEYAVKQTDGVERDALWTPSEVAEQLEAIGRWAKPAAPAAPGAGGPAALVKATFENLQEAFRPEKAEGWSTVMSFDVEGAEPYTVRVQDGKCTTEPGLASDATCKVSTDLATLAGMIDGSVDGNKAFMAGKIKASKLPDMAKFGKVFPFDAAFLARVQGAAGGGGGAGGPAGLVKATFENLHEAFQADAAGDWTTVMTFEVEGGEPFTVRVADGTCTTEAGAAGDATCVVSTDLDTLAGMIDGSVDGNKAFMAGKIKATKLPDMAKFGKVFRFDEAFLSRVRGSAGGAAPAAPKRDLAGELAGFVEVLPKALDPEKAKGYVGNLWFQVEGGDDFAVLLEDGRCTVQGSKPSKVACTVTTDAATLVGLFRGEIAGADALEQKKLVAKPPTGLLKFRQAFSFGEELVAEADRAANAGDGLVNPRAVGKVFRGSARFATPQSIEAYAKATNDTAEHYMSHAGDAQVSPPVYPVTFVMDLFEEAMTDDELAIDMSRVVHGEQEIRYHRPLRPWDLVNPRCKVTSITEKSSGWLVGVRQSLWVDGELAVEMDAGIFVRGHKKGDTKKGAGEAPARPEALYTHDKVVDPDQSERYADASGDRNPIHLDAEFAKSVGLPDRILHGLCTMAMAAGSIVEESLGGDVARLRSIKVRFSKPVLMGDTLTTEVWETGRDDRDVHLGFEVRNQRGETVLTNGEAHVLD